MADMTNEERERAVLEYLAEDRRWRRFNDISLNTGVIDLDETLEELNDKGFIYYVDDKACITHTGEDALAQTASEARGDGAVMADPAFFDTREAYLANQVETLQMDVKLGTEEIDRLTRELAAANAKIASALAVDTSDRGKVSGATMATRFLEALGATDEGKGI